MLLPAKNANHGKPILNFGSRYCVVTSCRKRDINLGSCFAEAEIWGVIHWSECGPICGSCVGDD